MVCRARGQIQAALSVAALSVVALVAQPALADDFAAGLLFTGFGASAKIQGAALSVGEDTFEPEPLRGRNLVLDGEGALAGAGIQPSVTILGVRVGLGMSVFGIEKTRFRHDPLPDGLRLIPSNPWGVRLDGFLGYEFLHGRVRPYLDLVAAGSFIQLDVDLRHPTLGALARTTYGGGSFNLGPRAGLSIGLTGPVFADVSATYSVFGYERLRVTGGIGFRTD